MNLGAKRILFAVILTVSICCTMFAYAIGNVTKDIAKSNQADSKINDALQTQISELQKDVKTMTGKVDQLQTQLNDTDKKLNDANTELNQMHKAFKAAGMDF